MTTTPRISNLPRSSLILAPSRASNGDERPLAQVTPELAQAVARAIARSANVVLVQRCVTKALQLSSELGNNCAQHVVLLLASFFKSGFFAIRDQHVTNTRSYSMTAKQDAKATVPDRLYVTLAWATTSGELSTLSKFDGAALTDLCACLAEEFREAVVAKGGPAGDQTVTVKHLAELAAWLRSLDTTTLAVLTGDEEDSERDE